jgi:DNA-binding transcriptional ArsR family regulator
LVISTSWSAISGTSSSNSDENAWLLPNDLGTPQRYRLAPQFTLYPTLLDRRAAITFHDGRGRMDALFYSLPGARRILDADLARVPSALGALLGPQRAAVLQHLDAAMTAGELADRLHLARGGLTHHLKTLEAWGLIRRTPAGRHVVVERTARGSSLLALYE